MKPSLACEETGVSGRAAAEDRHGLQEALALAKAGKVKKILVHEVSRLGRRPSVVMSFMEALEGRCVSLCWHAQSIETLLPNCKRNPAAGIMLALLAEMAQAEVETMRERINSGLAEARRKGVTLGRPVGSGLDAAALLAKHKDVVKALKAGHDVGVNPSGGKSPGEPWGRYPLRRTRGAISCLVQQWPPESQGGMAGAGVGGLWQVAS